MSHELLVRLLEFLYISVRYRLKHTESREQVWMSYKINETLLWSLKMRRVEKRGKWIEEKRTEGRDNERTNREDNP